MFESAAGIIRDNGGLWGMETVIPAQAGIRRRLDGKGLVFSVPFGIPAYAGMTVGGRPGRTVESLGRTAEIARQIRPGVV